MSIPKTHIWWTHDTITSTGDTYPGLYWKGFSAVLRSNRDHGGPLILSNCEKCAVFRWKRRGRKSRLCSCSAGKDNHSYSLDPWAIEDSGFRHFRRAIGDQLRVEETYFRKHFFNVLQCYPQLNHDDFRLRIFLDVKHRGVSVRYVRIENWDREVRKGTPWGERANMWDERIHRQHPQYVGVGVVVVEFEVHCPGGQVQFEVQMGLPLGRLELPRKVRNSRKPLPFNPPAQDLDWDWAYDFADSLSDEPPLEVGFQIV